MRQKTKFRLKLVAVLFFLGGVVSFVGALPTALPPDEVAAARAVEAEWQARRQEDLIHGRPSHAGPPPALATDASPWSPSLVMLSFVSFFIGIVIFVQAIMG